MIRKITSNDKDIYVSLVQEFYNTDAVMHKIPTVYIANSFEEMLVRDTYAEGFILATENTAVGYAIISKTYSQEAGGMVLWLEEIYIQAKYRNLGLGKEFFNYINNNSKDFARIRLEVETENCQAINLYKKFGYHAMPYMPMYKEVAHKV